MRNVGTGSRSLMWRAYRAKLSSGAVRASVRYLGGRRTLLCNAAEEKQYRLRAASSAWAMLSAFWAKAPQKIAKMVFRCMVAGAALSRLVAYVMTSADIDGINRLLSLYYRKLVKGK